jgi:hypothetical protein
VTDQPADLLTAAATALREAATSAIHDGRTTWQLGNTLGSKSPVVVDDTTTPTVLIETWAKRLEAVNAYLALVGPATGLAVAAWLDKAAKRDRAGIVAAARVWPDNPAEQRAWVTAHQDDEALAVARAVLGQDGGQQ